MDVLNCTSHKTITVYIKKYLEYLQSLNYSPKSVTSYKHALNRFASFLTANIIGWVADVTAEDLAAYRLELVDSGYTGQSISLYLRTVRKLFNHLEQTQQIFVNPAQSLIIPKVAEELKPVPTEADLEILLAQPDTSTPTGIRDRAIMETFYSTGLRLNELTGMMIRNTDLEQGGVNVTGKGGRQRVVPLGKYAAFWTDKYLKEVRPRFLRERPDDDALWLGFAGKRIHHLTVERFVKNYGETAGLSCPVTPHTLRRACATHMLRGGAHPVAIQMLLGHESLRVLSRYLKITITDMMTTHAQGRPGQ